MDMIYSFRSFYIQMFCSFILDNKAFFFQKFQGSLRCALIVKMGLVSFLYHIQFRIRESKWKAEFL